MSARPLSGVRVCDLSGQLAGAGATKYLAAMGAEVIRVEDPIRQGQWDLLRGIGPFVDERRGINLGGGWNNHNLEKLGVTINLKLDEGKDLLRRLIGASDIVTENFSAGALARLGFTYEAMRDIRPDIIYVSNSGFGHGGPYTAFKSWGPIVQALSGLTATSRLPGQPPAGYGLSYMDHHGANYMTVAILSALIHRQRTGAGQWIDMSCVEAGASFIAVLIADADLGGTAPAELVRHGSNRGRSPDMVPHGVYPTAGDDNWVAIACRDDNDWNALAKFIGEDWAQDARFAELRGRIDAEDELDGALQGWTRRHDRRSIAAELPRRGVPAAIVARPNERIDEDPSVSAWNLFPIVTHSEIGKVRVEGFPIHLAKTDWHVERGGPCLGEHNDVVFGDLLGLSPDEISGLRERKVI
jgi:benzylsuccinate CoA-transferase BbsF subunit